MYLRCITEIIKHILLENNRILKSWQCIIYSMESKCTINQIYLNKCMSYLLSSAISLFVRSDKVFAGSTSRLCLTCTALRDSLTPFLEF